MTWNFKSGCLTLNIKGMAVTGACVVSYLIPVPAVAQLRTGQDPCMAVERLVVEDGITVPTDPASALGQGLAENLILAMLNGQKGREWAAIRYPGLPSEEGCAELYREAPSLLAQMHADKAAKAAGK